MYLDAHRQAGELMARAELSKSAGNRDQAAMLYSEAARFENIALSQIPSDRVRTRGIIGIRATSLHIKAGEAVEAKYLADRLLADATLPQYVRDELLDLVLDVEQVLVVRRYAAFGLEPPRDLVRQSETAGEP